MKHEVVLINPPSPILKYWTQYQDDVYSNIVGNKINLQRDGKIIEILKRFIPDAKFIADIGTGSGHLANELMQLGYVPCGCDLSKVINACKIRYPKVEFLEFNAEKDIPAPVDVIIASEIVEHLANDFGFLQRCKMAANHIIITIPYSTYIHAQDHHMRAYSRYSMQKLLTIAGFETKYYYEDNVSQFFYAKNIGGKE